MAKAMEQGRAGPDSSRAGRVVVMTLHRPPAVAPDLVSVRSVGRRPGCHSTCCGELQTGQCLVIRAAAVLVEIC